MGWRLYLALAVLLVLGADARPQHVKHDEAPQYVISVYTGIRSRGCAAPASILFSEPQDAYLERNRVAAAAFGERRQLDVQAMILQYSCLRSIVDNLDAYRRRGAVTLNNVYALLDWAGLWRVQVVAAPEGIRFAGSTGVVCIAGIYMPAKTVVAVIAPLPDTGRCLT